VFCEFSLEHKNTTKVLNMQVFNHPLIAPQTPIEGILRQIQ